MQLWLTWQRESSSVRSDLVSGIAPSVRKLPLGMRPGWDNPPAKPPDPRPPLAPSCRSRCLLYIGVQRTTQFPKLDVDSSPRHSSARPEAKWRAGVGARAHARREQAIPRKSLRGPVGAAGSREGGGGSGGRPREVASAAAATTAGAAAGDHATTTPPPPRSQSPRLRAEAPARRRGDSSADRRRCRSFPWR